MKTLLRRATAMIALIALAVTLLPPSALAEAKTSFVRPQIDSRPAKPDSEAAHGIEKDSLGIEIVPHKTENPMRSEIWDGSIATGFAGGTGTEDDPYLISNGSELAYLAQEVNGFNSYSGVYFKLANDIYLNDTSNWESWADGDAPQNEWTAIGGYNIDEELTFSFDGYFDGDGYAVRGIYINTQEDYQGLFGYIGGGSIVVNLGVAESYICGDFRVGGVVGSDRGDTTNCYNTGSVTGNNYVGGVVGCNAIATVTGCYNAGSVNGESNVGGVVGENFGDVIDCHNTGNVTGNNYVGGVIGRNDDDVTDCYNTGSVTGSYVACGGVVGCNAIATVTNCCNTGSVTGRYDVSGVVGNNGGDVTSCYSTGSVTGEDQIGGVVGWNDRGNVTNCYNTGSITGEEQIGGAVGMNNGNVTDCYNTGSITGEKSIGGVVGVNQGYYYGELDIYCNATITNCYNTGSVDGAIDIGGVVGVNDDIITNCYYLDTCCDNGNEYGTALTDEQMQASESFIGFDFVEVWTMDGNPEYPYPELIGNEHGGMATVTPGDANGDGIVTIADATLVARMALNLTESVPAADFNGDGNISMVDATLTARKALNLI